jgi:hypothetical protein
MFSQIKAISEESLIDKLIELNITKSEDKSLADLITELDDTYLLETLFKAQWSLIENLFGKLISIIKANQKVAHTEKSLSEALISAEHGENILCT